MSDEARKFAEEWGGVWNEHHKYLVSHWQHEVANDYTRSSYWDWVIAQLDKE